MDSSTSPPHIELREATKRYGAVTVLDRVSFDVRPGEVHVLAGENGAGKSTLIKILGGVILDYEGTLQLNGQPTNFRSPFDAVRRGVSVIHQELSLVPSMSVVDNLFVGDVPTNLGFVKARAMRDEAKAALARVGLNLRLDTLAGDLPISTQQLIEVAKALRHRANVVVMDEPTSALNVQEAARLFDLIAELKGAGVGVVYISHKMEEIERLADRITVLRDGQWVATEPASQIPPDRLIRLMVGEKGLRPADDARSETTPGEPCLEVRGVTLRRNDRTLVEDVSLSVRQGEVVGLAGLEGSGNSALLLALFGAFGRLSHGSVKIDGKDVRIANPRDAVRAKMALLTSDRKATGLVLPLSITANASLASLPKLSPGGWRSDRRERELAVRSKQELSIRAANLEMPVGSLSGGNQQKVALAKWIATQPKVLLLDEPTRGIDINAKREIYAMIEKWKAEGMAIVLITSELPELLLLSDRIAVMHRGRVVTEMSRSEATADRVVQAAMNIL